MNEEQLKQLKEGDEIFIRARYKKTYADGDVSFLHSNTNVYDVEIEMESYTHPGNVILPSELQPIPKYDPTRLFKKGDRVRIVKYAGRCYTTFWEAFVGGEMFVETSETVYSLPEVKTAKGVQPIDPAYLELVTPVEELEPYFVMELKGAYGVYNTRFQPETEACHFFADMHPHAKEAAEAECARLNEEYRKEQNNGNQ